MNKLLPGVLHQPGVLCLLFATCAGSPAPGPDSTTADLQAARAFLANGEPDAALAITDRLTREHPALAAAWQVAGEGNLALVALDRPSLDPAYVRRDAEHAFSRATSLDETNAAAWLGLGQARFQIGEFEAARAAGVRAAELRRAAKAPAPDVAVAVALAGNCDLQLLIAARTQELRNGRPDERGFVRPEASTLELAQRALQEFETVQPIMPGQGFAGSAQVYEWLDQKDNALLELERGVRSAPDAADVHLAFQDLHVRLDQQRALAGAYSRLVRENAGVPILLWYQGRAQVIVADDLRGKQSWPPAIDAYRKGLAAYAQYAAAVPAHRDSAAQWQAICELSIARAATDMGDLESARTHLFAAADVCALATEYDGEEPRLKDSFGSHFAGVVFAIGRALSTGGADSLPAVIAFHEQVIERFPGKWGFVYNNGALPARDLGVLLARDLDGKSSTQREQRLREAMALWEKSYRWYEEAARLSPDDARIQNDCGLMLIYHLNRDFDRARALFERAIAVGQPQLDALPASASADERNNLEEAIGDAWQNIGVLLSRHLQRPFTEQKPFLEKAIAYYPYQQREAARMLEREGRETPGNGLNPRTLRGQSARANTSVGAPEPQEPQGGSAEAFAKVKTAVDTLAQNGDLDAAMAAIDKAQKELARHAPFQQLRGEYALRYAKLARDEQRKGVEFLFADAVDALQKAVDLDSEPNAPRQLLAEAQYESGAFASAFTTASALLLHLQSQGGGEPAAVVAAHAVRGNAASKALMVDPAAGNGRQLAADARVSFRLLEQQRKLDAALVKAWADLELTVQAPGEAVAVWARALQRTPDDAQALAAVVDAAVAAGRPQLAVDALQRRDDPAGLWYLGRARFLFASDLRTGGRIDDALAELDRARTCFAQSMQKNQDFADSCQQWLAICIGKQGNAALAQKRWGDAERWLLESARLRPDQLNQDQGLQETTKIGIMLLADHFLQGEDLASAERIYRAACEAVTNDLDLLNNAGLFARDLGSELERAGKQQAARAMYEQSYAAYGKALLLDPTHVQLRNDKALIAIHHLDRDWQESKVLLDTAAKDGEQLLAEYQGDAAGRQRLESATGDCWENIALWHLERDQDAKTAKQAAERSLQLFPGAQRPGARRHLQRAEQMLASKEKQ